MPKEIVELRILPPFAIARLGSSPDPMDNYDFETPDPIGYRKLVPAQTLRVDQATGEFSALAPAQVRFRDAQGLIRPVAPFLEVWARFAGETTLVPLTTAILSHVGLSSADLKWHVHAANIKAYRRTGDPHDRIEAKTGQFSDHHSHELKGHCENFFTGKFIVFGAVRYLKPNAAFPQIRLRFTPAHGKVYGPPGSDPDPNLTGGVVYDDKKGKWKGYVDASDTSLAARETTDPAGIYAGWDAPGLNNFRSRGYLDDECDGIVEVEVQTAARRLAAYARIAAGPPSFAPDSLPVRTIGDELEQAMFGPDLEGPVTAQEVAEVRDIVHRALDTVRLMNTAQMNAGSSQPGVGMARMDNFDVNRALEPIVPPSLADALAIQARHERVLLALESGSLAWFARVLRDYNAVGDLSDDGRRKMPALMRGADSRHLALTRRQVSKVRAAAEHILKRNQAGGKP